MTVQTDLFGKKVRSRKPRSLTELEKHDRETINNRLSRQEWIRQQQDPNSRLLLTAEAWFVLNETWSCFINREFIATVLLATSFIEYYLSGLLTAKGFEKETTRGLGVIIKCCKKNQLLSEFIIEKVDYIRRIRNPFVHIEIMYSQREDTRQSDRIFSRSVEKNMDYDELLEHDAKQAIQAINLLLYKS